MSDSTISPAPVPSYNSPDPARTPTAVHDSVDIFINTYLHPNATIVKVEILGEDADARALVEKAVRMALTTVLEPIPRDEEER
jgi:hypothetical protein